jgi:hypothetical protein
MIPDELLLYVEQRDAAMLLDVERRSSNRQLNALLGIDRRSGQVAVHGECAITEGPARQKDRYGHLENPGFRGMADAVRDRANGLLLVAN